MTKGSISRTEGLNNFKKILEYIDKGKRKEDS
jgi:hypothetical protein